MSTHDHATMFDLLVTLQSHGFPTVDGILGYIRHRPTYSISDIPR